MRTIAGSFILMTIILAFLPFSQNKNLIDVPERQQNFQMF